MCCSCNTLAWMTLKHDCSTIPSSQTRIKLKKCAGKIFSLCHLCPLFALASRHGLQRCVSAIVAVPGLSWQAMLQSASVLGPCPLSVWRNVRLACPLQRFPKCFLFVGLWLRILEECPSPRLGTNGPMGIHGPDFEMPISTKHCGIGWYWWVFWELVIRSNVDHLCYFLCGMIDMLFGLHTGSCVTCWVLRDFFSTRSTWSTWNRRVSKFGQDMLHTHCLMMCNHCPGVEGAKFTCSMRRLTCVCWCSAPQFMPCSRSQTAFGRRREWSRDLSITLVDD